MKILQFMAVFFWLFSTSTYVYAGYPPVIYLKNLPESINLMQGNFYCSWHEGQDYKDLSFSVYTDTANMSGDGCHVALPIDPTTCDDEFDVIADFFDMTENCQFWRRPWSSVEFLCKATRSDFINMYYDLCELMNEFEQYQPQ